MIRWYVDTKWKTRILRQIHTVQLIQSVWTKSRACTLYWIIVNWRDFLAIPTDQLSASASIPSSSILSPILIDILLLYLCINTEFWLYLDSNALYTQNKKYCEVLKYEGPAHGKFFYIIKPWMIIYNLMMSFGWQVGRYQNSFMLTPKWGSLIGALVPANRKRRLMLVPSVCVCIWEWMTTICCCHVLFNAMPSEQL